MADDLTHPTAPARGEPRAMPRPTHSATCASQMAWLDGARPPCDCAPTPTGTGEAPPEGWPAWLRRVASEIERGHDGEFAPYLESAAYAMETQARALHSAREEAGRLTRERITDSDTIRELRAQLAEWEEREAACCPEDVGFPEYIAALHRQAAARDAELAARLDLLDVAWGVIANAGGGDWTRESVEWQQAAARWRGKYHEMLDRRRAIDAARSGAGKEGQ